MGDDDDKKVDLEKEKKAERNRFNQAASNVRRHFTIADLRKTHERKLLDWALSDCNLVIDYITKNNFQSSTSQSLLARAEQKKEIAEKRRKQLDEIDNPPPKPDPEPLPDATPASRARQLFTARLKDGRFVPHPSADKYRLLKGKDAKSLATDIKANGLQSPILIDTQGQIVDGRNRMTALIANGVRKLPVADVETILPTDGETDDAYHGRILKLIKSANIHRRHLSKPEINELIAEKVWRGELAGRGRPEKGSDEPLTTVADISVETGQSPATVKRQIANAKQIAKDNPEAVEAVLSGEKTAAQVLQDAPEPTPAPKPKAASVPVAPVAAPAPPKASRPADPIVTATLAVIAAAERIKADIAAGLFTKAQLLAALADMDD